MLTFTRRQERGVQRILFCTGLVEVVLQGKYFAPLSLIIKTPTVEKQQEFLCQIPLDEQKSQMPARFVETFGTKSIRNVVFIADASRFRLFRLGF